MVLAPAPWSSCQSERVMLLTGQPVDLPGERIAVWRLVIASDSVYHFDSPAVLVVSQVERLSKLIEAPAEDLGTEGPVPSNTAASG